MISFVSFDKTDAPMMELALGIRTRVFVQEQGVEPALEYDDQEHDARYYLAFVDGTAVATARWRKTEKGIKLERFAVMPVFRNSGLGADLLKNVLADVKDEGLPVYLHSQARAVNFYLRNGFVVEGEAFYEANIEHYKMRLP
jgi:predicted GNAT family N-acyltransferase